jgi:integrase
MGTLRENPGVAVVSKKVPYLVRKGNRFYFRIRVPQQLVATLGKSELSQSLGNISQAQAAIQARELGHRFSSEFLAELHRLGLTANAPTPAPARKRAATLEEVTHIARAAARELLATDEEVRVDGMRSEGADYWLGVVADLDQDVSDALAEGRVGGIKARFEANLTAHGLKAPEDRSEARRMMRAWAIEHGKALEGIQRRSRGEPIETPDRMPLPESLKARDGVPLPADKKPASALKLRDVLGLWEAAKRDRPPKTKQKAERSVAVYEELTGDPPLVELTKASGSQFKAKLLKSDLGDKSAKDRLEWIQILLNFEATNYGRIQTNPWKGLAIEVQQEPLREEWKDADVVRLFDHPIFQRYELPGSVNAGGAAAYWVPLIGAYTGARITEIAQLLVSDLYEEGGHWYFRIEVTKPWQRLKNQWSRRRIPVHPDLIRLGLAEYMQRLLARGEERLFPQVAVSDLNNAGGSISKWFSDFKRAAGFGPENTFHGWRNTVETKLQRTREGSLQIDRYLGHAPEGTGQKVYARLLPSDLIETAAKIKYAGLQLPKVYGAGQQQQA